LIEARLFGSKTLEAAVAFARAAADAAPTMGMQEARQMLGELAEAVQECKDAKAEDVARAPIGTEADRKRERVITATQKILEDSSLFLQVALEGGRAQDKQQRIAEARAIAAKLPSWRAMDERNVKEGARKALAERDAAAAAEIAALEAEAEEAARELQRLQRARRPSADIELDQKTGEKTAKETDRKQENPAKYSGMMQASNPFNRFIR
jgi:fused signal recognition particle receptor